MPKPTNGTLKSILLAFITCVITALVMYAVNPRAETAKIEENKDAIQKNEAADRVYRAALDQQLENILKTLDRIEKKIER